MTHIMGHVVSKPASFGILRIDNTEYRLEFVPPRNFRKPLEVGEKVFFDAILNSDKSDIFAYNISRRHHSERSRKRSTTRKKIKPEISVEDTIKFVKKHMANQNRL